MRWECKLQGCFNLKRRPKIEAFAECFPGRIAMGDIDGCVEINGHFLFLEWKGYVGPIPTGQAITFKALTAPEIVEDRHTVYVVAGDAESMKVDAVKAFRNGQEGEWKDMDKAALCDSIKKWVATVKSRPHPRVQVRLHKTPPEASKL